MTLRDWIRRLPWMIVLLTIGLLAFGWLGIGRSLELAERGPRMLHAQMVWSVLGLGAMVAVTLPNYRVLCRFSYVAFGVVVVLLVAVYGFAAINGSHRWIRVGPLGMQPSEFAKVIFVLMLARYLMYRENFRRPAGLLAPLALAMVPVLLILREPDLGTAVVFVPVLLLMLLAAGARRRDIALVMLAGMLTTPVVWAQMSREQRSRVTALFEQTEPGEAPTGDSYHLHQAKQMLALGGVRGSWLTGEVGADRSLYHVPEGATDSILAVIGERFGLVGISVLLLTYILLVWRLLVIAERTREPFGRLVAAGIASLFAVQVVINSAMMVGLLPITGLSLPLVSYGGSGLVAHALALGLALNVGLRPGYEVTPEPFRYLRKATGATARGC